MKEIRTVYLCPMPSRELAPTHLICLTVLVRSCPVRALTEGDCPARSLQSMLITVRITMRLGSLTDSFKVTETHIDRLATLSILQALSFTAPPHAISSAIQYVGTMSHRKIVKNL